METQPPNAGQFLRPTLKPSLVEWKPIPREQQCVFGSFLETFLGGMETDVPDNHVGNIPTLKPSLVEWKLARTLTVVMSGMVLETFLGGMETLSSAPEPKKPDCSLKPSLVEWKLPSRRKPDPPDKP